LVILIMALFILASSFDKSGSTTFKEELDSTNDTPIKPTKKV
jgi:hypothetical protein